MKLTINSLLVLLFIFIVVLNSCYEHPEGCRNTNALNFDVTADKDCDDNCCKFPEVNIRFALIQDSIEIDSNTFLVNNFDDTFRITELKMYFSDFYLLDNSGDSTILNNTVKLGLKNTTPPIYRDTNYSIVKINMNLHNYKIGTIKKRKIYKQMNFSFGIKPGVNKAILDKVSNSSPLATLENDMYIDSLQGFYFLKIKIRFSDFSSKEIYISGDTNYFHTSIPVDLDLTERKNHNLNLDLDISKWISPINMRRNNNIEIENSLKYHLNKSLKLYSK